MKPVILIALFYAAQLTPTGDERLDRIRSKMSENLESLPNYTCLMSVDRWSERSRTTMQHDDTLHLEVAEVGHNELVGWPGSKLGERRMEDMVSGGLVASGDFSSVAKIVFRSKVPTFEFSGNKKIGGRAALQYRFHVDQRVSNYEVTRSELRNAVVGYSGSISVDAESLELERLEIVLDNIPKEIGITSAVTLIDYQKVRIGGGDFLLPAKVERNVKTRNGSHSKNITTLSECKKYGAESAIRFDDPDTPAEPLHPPSPR